MGHPIPIDDLDDPRLAPFRLNERGLASRAQRRDDSGAGLFLAEGDLVVERALDAGCTPVVALLDRAASGEIVERVVHDDRVEVFVGGEQVRRAVTGLGMVHPVVALFERPPRPSAAELAGRAHRLVVVEAVDNPSNIGSIVRNAAALGWDGLLLDRTSADPLARRSIRVAMGTVFTLPHARCTTPDGLIGLMHDLAARGAMVVALTPAVDATDLDMVSATLGDRPRALLIGSERDGLSAALMAAATHRARIPMTGGVDSLNAAAATAIACHVLR